MAKGRRLKKVNGDLEAQNQMLFHHNSQLGNKMLFHQNQELWIKQSMWLRIGNSNNEILSNTNWEFWMRNVGLDCFKIYIHWSNATKKIVQKYLNLIILTPSII